MQTNRSHGRLPFFSTIPHLFIVTKLIRLFPAYVEPFPAIAEREQVAGDLLNPLFYGFHHKDMVNRVQNDVKSCRHFVELG